jgi:hypothetical protein
MEAASNAGIAACDSDYIVIHDDDDSWCPDFLERTVAFLDGPAGARYGGVRPTATYMSEEIRGDRVIEHEMRPYNDWVRNVQLSEMACGNFFPADRLRVPPRRSSSGSAASTRRCRFSATGSSTSNFCWRTTSPSCPNRWRAITTATGATRPLPPMPIRSSAACRNTRNSPPSPATPSCDGMATGRGVAASFAMGYGVSDLRGRIGQHADPPRHPPRYGRMKVCDDRLWCVRELNEALSRRASGAASGAARRSPTISGGVTSSGA